MDQILRLELADRLAVTLFVGLDVGLKTERFIAKAFFDDLFEADECAAANEKNIRRIKLLKVLLRMLASAAGRNIRDGSLEDLQ